MVETAANTQRYQGHIEDKSRKKNMPFLPTAKTICRSAKNILITKKGFILKPPRSNQCLWWVVSPTFSFLINRMKKLYTYCIVCLGERFCQVLLESTNPRTLVYNDFSFGKLRGKICLTKRSVQVHSFFFLSRFFQPRK